MSLWKQVVRTLEHASRKRDVAGRQMVNRLLLGGSGADDTCDEYSYTLEYEEDMCKRVGCWMRQEDAEWFPNMAGNISVERDEHGKILLTVVPEDPSTDLRVEHSTPVAEGGYAYVYEGFVGDEPVMVKLPKSLYGSQEDVREVVLQVSLQCASDHKRTNPPIAKIPKVHALARVNSVNLVAIQPLEDTLKSKLQEFAHSKAGFRTLARESLRQVAGLLRVLQNTLGFEHRDLHTNNVMYNIERNTFQFYIIDFGFTRTKQMETGTSDRRWPSHFIAGGDLAMLVMDIYGLSGRNIKFLPKGLRAPVLALAEALQRVVRGGENMWKGLYRWRDFFHRIEPLVEPFTPANVLRMIGKKK